MAMTTAGCFLILSVAFLAEFGHGIWPWSLVQGESLRARMMRSFLPIFAGFVLLIGFLDSRVDVSSGPLIPAVILLVSLPFLALLVARTCGSLDASVMAAEAALRESEEKLSKLFEFNPAKIAIGALDGKIVDANLAYADFLGYSREEMRGKSLVDLGIISVEELRRLLALGHAGAPLRNVEVAMRPRGGGLLDVLLSMETISLGGKPHRIATLVDITERKQIAESLKESEQRFRQIAENIQEVFWMSDSKNEEIFYISPAYEKIWGRSCESLYADPKNWADAIVPEDKERVLKSLSSREPHQDWAAIYRINRPDGKVRWIRDRSFPVKNAAGFIYRIVGVAKDITERKLAEEKSARLAAIVEASPDFIGIADPKTTQIQYINKYGRKMCGIGADEDVGKYKIGDVLPAWMNERFAEVVLSTVAREGVWKGEGAFLRRDDSEIPVSMILSAYTADNGEIDFYYTVSRDITGQKLREGEIRKKAALLEAQTNATNDGFLIVDGEGKTIIQNQRCVEMWKIPKDIIDGHDDKQQIEFVKNRTTDPEKFVEKVVYLYTHPNESSQDRVVFKDGTVLERYSAPVIGSDGTHFGRIWRFHDITEQIRLEENLRQSQKMESVGRLAGGVAHDFNNILTAIKGYTGFALAGLSEGDQRRKDLNEVMAAGERATRLTRQLLAFSRKQILNPQVIDINATVAESANMLKRLIGEDIRLETRLAAEPCRAKVDTGQIEQVFLNLAVNARDAMPKGGVLTFETQIMSATEEFSSRHPDVPRGPLVCLSARDTGCGMTDAVKAHLFEPFFTTKEKGKGTGLGLSMVYGIIKQSGGEIEVESTPDIGTTFRIYFPLIIDTQDKNKDKAKDIAPRGNETVLFVEDEDALRRLGARVLTGGGYNVLFAANGREALEVLERHGKAVDLLITDVVMPGMSGRELSQAIAAKNMARRTLFMSGFTEDAIVRHGVLEPGLAFMYKPFSPDALLCKMREVLDGPVDKAKA